MRCVFTGLDLNCLQDSQKSNHHTIVPKAGDMGQLTYPRLLLGGRQLRFSF
jgi:hypothetical protein